MCRTDSPLLDRLATLARLAAAGADVPALLEAAVSGAGDALGADRVAVFELVPGPRLLLRTGSGWREGITGAAMIEAAPGTAWANALERAQVLESGGGEESSCLQEALLVSHGVKAGLHAPVRAGGKAWGLLGVYAADGGVFTPCATRYLQAAADILGTAIAARSMQESSARLSSAVEQAAEAIMITKADGTIVYVNPAFEKTTGYLASEAVGRTPALLKSGSVDRSVYRDLWNTVLGGRVWRGEITNRARDGSVFTWEETITPVRNAAGAITEFIAIGQDTTARRDLEARLRQSQKMEAVGRLAGGVAHDFNNLLTVIIGYSEQMLAALDEASPLGRKARAVKRAAERAASLTQQLLAFSRRQMLAPRVFDLNASVRNVEGLLRRLIGEDIRLEILLDPDAGCVRADPHQVEQVIMNLAVNGRDAMPRGGTLTIRTAATEVDEAAAREHVGLRLGSYATLAVTDTGCGIDDAVRAHLFEPFFTTKEHGKGTGLGLSTIFGIVKQSGGYIAVDTAVGRGSTFTVYLPRVERAEAVSPEPGPPPPRCGSGTILIVEDEVEVRTLVGETLEAAGFRVLQAAGGEEALRVLDTFEGPLDLVITDVVMPGVSGWDVARSVKQRRPATRLLFVSGYTEHPEIERALGQSEIALLNKPFTRDRLLETIGEVLGTGRPGLPRPGECYPDGAHGKPESGADSS